MHVIQLLKLCIVASLAGSMFIGILFMMRADDEDSIRSHVKGVMYRQQLEKLQQQVQLSHSNQPSTASGAKLLPPLAAAADALAKLGGIHEDAQPKTAALTTPRAAAIANAAAGVAATAVASAQELVKSPRPPSVHIFYYPWYGEPKFDEGRYYHWNHEVLKPSPQSRMRTRNHTPPDDIASAFYPQLGPYSSRNPAVIDKHMQWMSSAGVDVVSISWYPPHKADAAGHAWDPLMPTLLDAADKYKLKVCIHLEPYDDRTAKSVRADIAYAIDTYGAHAAFYRTASKTNSSVNLPLFYIYDSYKVLNEDWRSITTANGSETIRGTKSDALLIEVLRLGLALKLNDVSVMRESGFDGLYTYFAADGFTEASSAQNWAELSRRCADAQMLFVPSLGPGYDDLQVRPWNGQNTRGRESGAYYKRHFEAAHAAKADIVSITSFNEWHEGTQIEPAIKYTVANNTFIYQEYNKEPEQYLQLTHEMVRIYFTRHHDNIAMNIAKIV